MPYPLGGLDPTAGRRMPGNAMGVPGAMLPGGQPGFLQGLLGGGGGPQRLMPQNLGPPGQVSPMTASQEATSNNIKGFMGGLGMMAPSMVGGLESMQQGNINPLMQRLLMQALSGQFGGGQQR